MEFTSAAEARDTSDVDRLKLQLVDSDIRSINEAIAAAKKRSENELMIQVPSRGRQLDSRQWLSQVGSALQSKGFTVTVSTSSTPHIRISW